MAAGILVKADFKVFELEIPNTDVLPNAFGVVVRLEKADCMGCDEVDGTNVPLNELEGTEETAAAAANGEGVGLGPKLLVNHFEALG